jgi:hypothetical protein
MSSHEAATGGADDRDVSDRARVDFLDFLNEVRPSSSMVDSLTFMLRTEAPQPVTSDEVLAFMTAWADDHARAVHQPISVVMLGALRKILDAARHKTLTHFDPDAFLDATAPGLMEHCPPSELTGFRAAVRDLRASLAPAPAPEAAPVGDAETVEVHGERMPIRAAQETAISRLEHEAYMTDADFEAAFADLQAAVSSRLGLPVQSALSRIAKAAAKIFNTGRIRQAARLFGFVEQAMERLAVPRDARLEIRSEVSEADLNEGLMAKALNDPEQRVLVAPMLRMVGYLTPGEALVMLAVENRRERRRLLLAAIENAGPEAYPYVLDHLSASSLGNQPWFATRNYLYLLSRIDAPDDVVRRRAIETVGKYVTHDQPQLRTAAIAALRRIGGRDIIPYVVRVLDPNAYAAGSIDDTDNLKRHLYQAFETIVETGNEAAVAIVAEFGTGTRGSEFDLGQTLRDEACTALTHVKGPLPRRAALVIANYLGNMVNRKFKFVTGKLTLGLDTHACRMLSTLIRNSTEPEAQMVLNHPLLVKVLSRGTGELG